MPFLLLGLTVVEIRSPQAYLFIRSTRIFLASFRGAQKPPKCNGRLLSDMPGKTHKALEKTLGISKALDSQYGPHGPEIDVTIARRSRSHNAMASEVRGMPCVSVEWGSDRRCRGMPDLVALLG